MNFYHTHRNIEIAPVHLEAFGLPNDVEVLKSAGIYPIIEPELSLHRDYQFIRTTGYVVNEEDQTCTRTFTVEEHPLEYVQADLIKKVKELRVLKENGGLTIEGTGTQLDSSRTDGQMVHNAYTMASLLKPDIVIDFKSVNGWITITLDALRSMFMLYSKHVENCFSQEKAIAAKIEEAASVQEALDIFFTETKAMQV